MSQHELNLIVSVAVVALIIFVGLNLVGYHPYRYLLHRRQRALLQGAYHPPQRSLFWDIFYGVNGTWIILSGFWLVLESRGWAIVSLVFSVFSFVGLAFSRDLYQRWYEQTPKWKCGTWRSLPVKELAQNRIVDRLKLRRTMENEKGKVMLEVEMPVEAGQTGGLSPEGAGITTPNRKAIVIAKSRKLSAEEIAHLKDAGFAIDPNEPFASGWPLGDIYFTPGDPIPFLMGYDRDPENPTPEAIREFVKAHPQHFRWKASTLILLIPDLYPAFEDADMTPKERPSGMEFVLYDNAHRIATLESRLVERGRADQRIRTSRGGAGGEYEVELER